MSRRLPQPSDDVTAYLVLNDHGQFGIAYVETDPAEADRETIIRNFLTGQYSNALRVVAFNTATSGRPRRPCDATPGSTRRRSSVERPAREAKKSPGNARAFGARTRRGGGGYGGTSFALTYRLDSKRRQKVRANTFTNYD